MNSLRNQLLLLLIALSMAPALLLALNSRLLAQRETILLLAVTSAIALLAGWFVGENLIARRVRALVLAAEGIAAGNFHVRTGVDYKSDELGLLARRIDGMAKTLAEQSAKRNQAETLAQRANTELVQNALRKDEFLAMLAHELRNPLAPIRNAAYLLKVMPNAEPRVTKAGAVIGRQVDHMSALVDDLLDVSRVTRGLVELDMQIVDLRRVVQSAVEQIKPVYDSKRHVFSERLPDTPALVRGDFVRLVQVVANVLTNAAKYTPDHGVINLTLARGTSVWSLDVTDNGNGIHADLLPRIFDIFSQGSRDAHRSQGGLGLGLALVKGLVRLHGGMVRATSEGESMGATMSIELPAVVGDSADATPSAVATEIVQSSREATLSVMVVDDLADVADTTGALLEEMGYKVAIEYTAGGALERAAIASPQICLLDIGMPEMDGYELVRRLRLLPQTRHAVMIAITGYGYEADKARAKAAGFDHHLVKPVDPDAFSELLNAVNVPEPTH